MKESFSVSMCVYHGDDAAHFQTAVESVLTQSCLPEEIILVVDGPVPEPLEEVIDELYVDDAVEHCFEIHKHTFSKMLFFKKARRLRGKADGGRRI